MTTKKKSSWQVFVGKHMSAYMKKYGSHGAAMRQLSKEWKKKGTSPTKTARKVSVKAYSVGAYTRRKAKK